MSSKIDEKSIDQLLGCFEEMPNFDTSDFNGQVCINKDNIQFIQRLIDNGVLKWVNLELGREQNIKFDANCISSKNLAITYDNFFNSCLKKIPAAEIYVIESEAEKRFRKY